MTTTIVDPSRSRGVYRFLRSIPTWVLWLLVLVWVIPTLGLLVNSFRDRAEPDHERVVDRLPRQLGRLHHRELPARCSIRG